MSEISESDQRLLDAIFGPNGTNEKTHDSNCFACDLAVEISGSIAAYVHFGTRVREGREERDGWELPATLDYNEAVVGDTRLDLMHRIVAHELHKRLPGHGGKDR